MFLFHQPDVLDWFWMFLIVFGVEFVVLGPNSFGCSGFGVILVVLDFGVTFVVLVSGVLDLDGGFSDVLDAELDVLDKLVAQSSI